MSSDFICFVRSLLLFCYIGNVVFIRYFIPLAFVFLTFCCCVFVCVCVFVNCSSLLRLHCSLSFTHTNTFIFDPNSKIKNFFYMGYRLCEFHMCIKWCYESFALHYSYARLACACVCVHVSMFARLLWILFCFSVHSGSLYFTIYVLHIQ